MGFKPGEIVAIVIALAVPIIGFAVLVSPGAVAAIYEFVLRADVMPFVFFGGAAIVFAVLSLAGLPPHQAEIPQAGSLTQNGSLKPGSIPPSPPVACFIASAIASSSLRRASA